MNKIIVKNNKIVENDLVSINNNRVKFNISGSYELEYIDSSNIELVFDIDNCNIELFDCIFSDDIDVNNIYNVKNGSLKMNNFYCNRNVNSNISINLLEEGDSFTSNFSSICSGIEKYVINVNHKNKNTVSNIFNKSVAINDGDIKFIINSSVEKDCIKSSLDQNTRIVTLDNSRAMVSPNMFIDLDDVIAKHGSVIGTFKEEQVFYLMSKGIDYFDAIKLMVKGYLLSNVDVTLDTRIKIMNKINEYWG